MFPNCQNGDFRRQNVPSTLYSTPINASRSEYQPSHIVPMDEDPEPIDASRSESSRRPLVELLFPIVCLFFGYLVILIGIVGLFSSFLFPVVYPLFFISSFGEIWSCSANAQMAMSGVFVAPELGTLICILLWSCCGMKKQTLQDVHLIARMTSFATFVAINCYLKKSTSLYPFLWSMISSFCQIYQVRIIWLMWRDKPSDQSALFNLAASIWLLQSDTF